MAQVQTEASRYVQQELQNRYSYLEFGGVGVSCRYIGGGWTCGEPTIPGSDYSQHAWNNALDIYGDQRFPLEDQQAMLDPVYDFLLANKDQLGIRTLIWRDGGAHENHIHADFWPHGHNIPECCPWVYINTWERSTGGLFSSMDPPMEAEGELSDPNELPLHRGDTSDLVQHYQERLIIWEAYFGYTALPTYGADGDFGAETEVWVKHYQGLLGWPQTGVIDEILAIELDKEIPVVEPPEPPEPPPVDELPPIDPVPPPELDIGLEGTYRKFFYPRKGRG